MNSHLPQVELFCPTPAPLIAMTTDGLPLKLVVEATRGAVIAVHAAGGLARGHAQALRLLRAAEGLCRSAVAVLQTDSSDPKKAWKAKGTGKGATEAREAEGTGQGAKVARGAKDNDKKDIGKRMDKDSDVNMVAKPGEPGAQPRRRRRRRRRRGRAPTGVVAFDPGFDDSWADGIHIPAPAQAIALPLSAVAGVEESPILDDADVRRRRPLVARRSRTPPGTVSEASMSSGSKPAAAIASGTSIVALPVGHVATIKGLVSRPELDGILVLLEAMDFTSGRWICRVNGGETLRILPEKLVPVPLQDQEMLRLRFDSS